MSLFIHLPHRLYRGLRSQIWRRCIHVREACDLMAVCFEGGHYCLVRQVKCPYNYCGLLLGCQVSSAGRPVLDYSWNLRVHVVNKLDSVLPRYLFLIPQDINTPPTRHDEHVIRDTLHAAFAHVQQYLVSVARYIPCLSVYSRGKYTILSSNIFLTRQPLIIYRSNC